MAADASIYGMIRPVQAPNQLERLAQLMQVEGLQNQGEMARYSIAKARRGDEETNALSAAIKGGLDLTTPEGQRQAYGVAPTIAPTYIKTNTEARTAEANLRKTQGEAVKQAVAMHREALAGVDNPQAAAQWLQAAYQNPDLKPLTSTTPLDAALGKIPADPAGFQNWRNQMALGMTKYVELNKPTIHMQNTGGASNVVSVAGLGGAPETLSSTPITQSADNKATVGASMANAAATREAAATNAKATRDAAQITGNQNTEMKLGDDYRAQSKNFKETTDAYKQITSVLDKATTSPAATLAGATKFMKMIDPGSVVRESELGMALAATGVFDRAQNYFNTLASGKVLTAKQVADFKDITRQINDAAAQQQKLIDGHYTKVAKQYGLRPEMVVQDFGQNAAPAAAGGVPPDIAAILATHGGKK